VFLYCKSFYLISSTQS